jgi:hypothetical protein
MIPLPRLFSQLFEHTDDHRSRHRLQSPLAVASGSTSCRQAQIRARRRLLNIVHHSIAAVHHRSKLAVDPLDILAKFHLAGEPPLFLFISCPRICIARLEIETSTESVPAYSIAPRRLPSQPSPVKPVKTRFKFEFKSQI